MAVNPDLIERAEPTPDTVITMTDGRKLVVVESVQEIMIRVRHWRASVVAEAQLLCTELRNDPDRRADPGGGDDVNARDADDADRNDRDRDDGDDGDAPSTDRIGGLTAMEASLARVLRLPQRRE